MVILTILSPFDQIAQPTKKLKELKIAIEVFHLVFGAVYQDHFLKLKSFYYSLHPNSSITPNFENFTLSL